MNEELRFFITGVFGQEYSSCCHLVTLSNASSLSDKEMQHIAGKIRFCGSDLPPF